ncbi:MAG: tRNA (guanosine(37)-N1)-methyltransferase TrmD [Opitutales bacterium]|nr:tRNA (guanosine(37)-N1)-methyltransferase TrmD [Opitutales bacterium]
MTIDLLTLFPEMVTGFLNESMLGRASKNGLLNVHVHNIRDWATGKHLNTDDRPFGGGAGMLLKPEPLAAAIDATKTEQAKVIYLCPDGELLTSAIGRELAQEEHLVLVSGHYEGIDQRIRDSRIDREISIGDYVLTNGTIAAAVLIDCLSRYIPGVLGEEKSLTQDSFNDNLLSFPQYTRPLDFEGMGVPEVLLSGHHEEIQRWRDKCRLEKTKARRPDLFKNH